MLAILTRARKSWYPGACRHRFIARSTGPNRTGPIFATQSTDDHMALKYQSLYRPDIYSGRARGLL